MPRAFANEPILTQIAAGLLVVAGLYWAQTVLVPIAIAILLSFLLAPIADWLERIYLPRVAALIVLLVLASSLITGVAMLAASQVYNLADSLPQYRQNIEDRLRFLTSNEPGVIDQAAKVVMDAREEVAEENKHRRSAGAQPAAKGPLPVEIHQPPPTALERLENYAAPLVGPLGQAALVVVFVLFVLFQREDLRDRMIRLMGQDRLDVTTRAFDDAGSRISRYLLMQLVINLTYGLPVGIGLWLMGLPGALLWGVLAALLRFIPFLGPWLAATMPILLSLAVFDGWYWPLAVAGLFIVIELFSNNVIEPWLYGSSTGLSPIGVILAVVFWSALWGLVGLVVAIPLTVCLVVAGRHLAQFRFFTILLSSDPALAPAERFYQRLLAGDQDEVEELTQEYFDEHGLMRLYDKVVVPALHLAERNRHAGQLGTDETQRVWAGVESLIENLGEQQKAATAAQKPSAKSNGHVVLCLPARDTADELTATMFCQVLRAAGVAAEAGSAHALASEVLARIDESGTPLVCISALPPGAVSHARYLCRRLDDRNAGLAVMVGLWDVSGNLARMRARLADAGANQVVTSFEDAADQVRRRLSGMVRTEP